MKKSKDKVIVIIPARGGSKGLPHKNIMSIMGRPLIHYAISACMKTPEVDDIYVSTDSDDIKGAVRELKEIKIIDRPDNLAADDTTSEAVIMHSIRELEDRGDVFDTVLFVQATSPLTEPQDFSRLLKKIEEGYDSASFYMEDHGFFFDEDDMESPRLPRQARKPRKREVGNGWAFKKQGFLKSGSRSFGRIALCKIESPKDLEIDTEIDFQLVERALQLRERKKQSLYYRSRATVNAGYEENYWGDVIDPDGKKRNRRKERDQRIADINEELTYINRLDAGRILDVGCGMGDLLSAVNEKWEKFGLEVSEFAAAEASKYGDIYVGSLKDSPYDNESFDLVVMHHIIEHLEEPEDDLIKIRKILKHDGKLIVATPDFDGAMARRYGDNYRLLNDKGHVSLFSRISLRQFLEDFGFEIEHESFPYFDTRHFSNENLKRLLKTDQISPPFWGSYMTFYSRKK